MACRRGQKPQLAWEGSGEPKGWKLRRSPQCSYNHCWWRGRPWPPAWCGSGGRAGWAVEDTSLRSVFSLQLGENFLAASLTSLTTNLSKFLIVCSFRIPWRAHGTTVTAPAGTRTISPPLDSPRRGWSPWRRGRRGTCSWRTWTGLRVWSLSGCWKREHGGAFNLRTWTGPAGPSGGRLTLCICCIWWRSPRGSCRCTSLQQKSTRRLKFVGLVQRNVGERMNFRPERLKSVLRV